MSDKRISELVELTSLAADDELVVVDADANGTKRVTYDTLATEVRTESEALTATTGTFSGDITSNGETVYHRGNILGTVSQSGGDPTGAVIERGSNANGDYVKFADGTLICNVFIEEENISPVITTKDINWTFPVEFFNEEFGLSANFWCIDEGTAFLEGVLIGQSQPSFANQARLRGADFNARSFDRYKFRGIAIGRWY